MRLFRRKQPQFQVPLSRRVRELEIVSSRLIRAGFAGDYHSAFHGRGIEFSQVREYQQHFLPQPPPPLKRSGVELGLRFTPLDSAGHRNLHAYLLRRYGPRSGHAPDAPPGGVQRTP